MKKEPDLSLLPGINTKELLMKCGTYSDTKAAKLWRNWKMISMIIMWLNCLSLAGIYNIRDYDLIFLRYFADFTESMG